MDFAKFAAIMAGFARVDKVGPEDVLFGGGLDLPSVAFLEFILELEAVLGRDIDVDKLDAGIRTAGQLHARLFD